MGGSGIHIGSAVDQQRSSFFSWDQGCKRRSFYSFEPSYDQLAAYQNRTRTSCADKCIGFSILHHLHGCYNGRILLRTDRLDRRLCHIDHFCGVHNFHSGRVILILLQLCPDCFLLSHQKYFYIVFFIHRFHGAFYDLQRRMVSAHGVYCNLYQFLHPLSSSFSIS